THCDWTTVEKETGFDILVEELRFFDHWLKGIDNGIMQQAPVTYYTYNLETSDIGIPGWHVSDSWPLEEQQLTEFKLVEGGLKHDGAVAQGSTEVTVDYEVSNDNFWEKGLTVVTEPLTQDTQITGHPVLRL